MRSRRLLAAIPGLVAVLALSAAGPPQVAAPRALDPDAFAVRLAFGLGDAEPQPWNGRVRLDRGRIVDIEGWRFREGDLVTGPDGWQLQSRLIRKGAAGKQAAAKKQTGPSTTGAAVTPNGVIVKVKAPAEATLTVTTDRREFALKLAELADGTPRLALNRQVEARRVAPSVPLVEGPAEDDFPAAALAPDGAVWVAYVSHWHRGSEVSEALTARPKNFRSFVPDGGGDQVRLLRFADGKPSVPIVVTAPGLDVWRPDVVVHASGKVVVAWSENREGNWDLYARTLDASAGRWESDPKRLTTDPGSDLHVCLAATARHGVWVAWQGWRDGQADILLAAIDQADQPRRVSDTPANEWTPTLATDGAGAVHVAYDTYETGDYDIKLWSASLDDAGPAPRTVTVAGSSRFEVRPSLALDDRGRAWVAFEERDKHWGKDAKDLVEGEGSSLYRSSAVRVRCVEGERIYDAPDPVENAESIQRFNSAPRIACDASGRPWLLFRHRKEAIWGQNAVMVVGAVWVEYATTLSGAAWAPPMLLPRSDGLLDNRPALVTRAEGPPLVVYSSDGRLRREVEVTPDLRRRFYTHSGTPAGVVDNDLQVAAIPVRSTDAAEPRLAEVAKEEEKEVVPVHPNEAEDIERLRSHRVRVGGKTYQLLRGEFHRHTEISQDGGNDGMLEDMWRYALDAADLDWMGNGDHDSGGGKEYTWWLIQKTTDMYQNAPAFTSMHTYERSVSYPHGHRNVMWPRRGVRTLPRLVDERGVSDADTRMLYAYLHELGGVCASHTSGTGMGTDWRDNDPEVEPVVEVFQGHRNSYEHLGAPRVARRASEANGGFRPLGMIWNALAMQYRLGFQASSDHISTHMSYAVAIAEGPTREAIFDAFKNRHCYAATDNILLDVRSGDHLMGDEFDADGPVRLKVLAHGTGPIKRVDIIKDFVYVYSVEPGRERVEFEWTDEETRPPGLSWYYVRVIQEDGELAWASPVWVRTRGDE